MVGYELCVRIELVRFGVGGVRERRCQGHACYCSGKNMGFLGDCEMLLACLMVCGASAEELPPFTKATSK